MNEIAQLLARPLPLGLMLVFFFVALAVGSLFIARVEAKHKRIQALYQAEIDRLRGFGGDLAGPYHDSSHQRARSGGWFGWLIALGLGAAVSVAVLVSLREGPSPELSAINSLTAPKVERVEPPAVKLGAVLAEPVRPIDSVKAPAPQRLELPAVRGRKNQAEAPAKGVAQTGAPQGAQAEGEDEEIERMLRWERQRAAERRMIRRRAKAQRTGQRAQATPRRPRAPAAPVERQAVAAPELQPEPRQPAAKPTDSLDSAEKAAEALLQEAPKPKKRRKKLRLDQSGDPLAS